MNYCLADKKYWCKQIAQTDGYAYDDKLTSVCELILSTGHNLIYNIYTYYLYCNINDNYYIF